MAVVIGTYVVESRLKPKPPEPCDFSTPTT